MRVVCKGCSFLRRLGWLALLLLTAGCTSTSADQGHSALGHSPAKLLVVCTTAQVGDILRHIGGPWLEVETLMGPGVDPHLYKPSHGDLRRFNRADIVCYSGLHLEGRLTEVLESLAQKKPTFAVTDGVRMDDPSRLRSTPEFAGSYDPHVWFDVGLWARCVDYTAAKMVEIDPEHADDYRRGADAYIAELEVLDQLCRQQIHSIPRNQRVLVTAHDAFGYFGRAYDIEVRGLQGISTADEANLREMNALVDLLVSRKVKAVFVESSVPPRNVQGILQACAALGHRVAVGGELYSDAMGAAGTPEAEYIGMVRHNLKVIVSALK